MADAKENRDRQIDELNEDLEDYKEKLKIWKKKKVKMLENWKKLEKKRKR